MISAFPTPQQGNNIPGTPDENTTALLPWTTPRLQRLDVPDETDAVVDPGSGFYIPPS